MESTASNATPNDATRGSEMKNEISINHKHKFESKHYSTGDVIKVLKRQSSLDVTNVQGKKDGNFKNSAIQDNRDMIHQKIEGILHKGSDNYGNYNKVNKGIQANFDIGTQSKTSHGKNITYSKSFDEAAYLNKKTQTSLENVNNPKIPSSHSLDGAHQHARRKKLEQIATDYYENEKPKITTVIEEQPSVNTRGKKLHLDFSGDDQEVQSNCYQRKMMSALNHNKSITPTDYEDKSFANTLYNRCSNKKSISDYYRKSGTNASIINGNHHKTKGFSQEQTSTRDEERRNISKTELRMKKSLSMQNYSESSLENCSNQSHDKHYFRPTTKSFSFDLEKREKSDRSNKPSGRQEFVKISKPNCDILRKHTSQYEIGGNCGNYELKTRVDKKALILHETKVTHPLESEPVEAIIGQGFAEDRRIQTPQLLRQTNERNQRDYCYWTTKNSRKNSASMISDEAIIGKGFLDDEEFIEFYSTKQPRLQQVPEELQACISAEVRKESPKFNLNKNEIKKYFLLHGNNEPVRANIKCEQGIYKEVPVKPIVKKVINVNDSYNSEELHFNLNYEVAGEVQNKDQNNNHYNRNVGEHEEKLYGKRDLNQNEYVELGVGRAKALAKDHHYEVLHNKHSGYDSDKLYEVPRILHDTTLEDDVFADEKTVKNLGEDYLNIPSTKYRKSPMLWYINDQVISFHHDIPAIVANKKISLPVSSNIRPLGFPSSTTSFYSLHNFDMHRQNPQMKGENYTSLIRPLVLG